MKQSQATDAEGGGFSISTLSQHSGVIPCTTADIYESKGDGDDMSAEELLSPRRVQYKHTGRPPAMKVGEVCCSGCAGVMNQFCLSLCCRCQLFGSV